MKLVYFFLLLFYSSTTIAQCYFFNPYRYYSNNSQDFGLSLLEKLNGNLISTVDFDYLQGNGGIMVIEVNFCGDTITKKSYDYSTTGGERGEVIIDINNTTLCIIGQAYDTLQQRREGFILFLDTLGNVINRKTLDAGAKNEIMRGGILVNNEIIIAGYFNELMPDSNIFLMKTDIEGNILWTKYYGIAGSGYSVLKSMDRAKDGGYILGGSVVRAVGSSSTRNLYVTKTDSLGNKEWTKEYANTYFQGGVAADREGNFVLVGNDRPSANEFSGYIGKMDSVGNIIWEKRFNQINDPDVFTNVIVLADGNYLVAGAISINGGAPAYIAKISRDNGEVIWSRLHSYYGGDTQNYIEDIILTEEGDIAATGYVIPIGIPTGYGNDMFILKTDSCGYLTSDSIEANFSYEQTSAYDISFTNQSQHYCTPLWYYGDGDSLYTNNPTHTYGDTGTYTVTLIVRAGNSIDTITQQVTVNGIVGIDPKTPKGGLRVYPNPASQEINIQIQNTNPDNYRDKIKIKEVKVYDVAGRVVRSQLSAVHSNVTKINVSGLEEGLYFIEVGLSNGSVERVKFIKQ